MKYIRYGAFIVLTVASGYLSINMFIALGSSLVGKALLGLVAFGLESSKVFSLLRIEYALHVRRVEKKKAQIMGSIFMYTALAILSIVASLGFNLVTVDRQVETSRITFSQVADEYEYDIQRREETIDILNDQMAALREQMREIDSMYATGSVRLSTEARRVSEERERLIDEISDLRGLQRESHREATLSDEVNVYGMFFLMGEAAGLNEKTVMLLLLFLISILIEVSMIYTSPTIAIKVNEYYEFGKQESKPTKSTKTIKAPKTTSKPKPSKKEVKAQAGKIQAIVTPNSPNIQIRNIPKRELAKEKGSSKVISLEEILQIRQGSELRAPKFIAEELGVAVDSITNKLVQLSKVKNSANKPYIYQKDAKWYLNFTKDYIIASIRQNTAGRAK